MALATANDVPFEPALVQTKPLRPPRPPAGLAAVLVDKYESGSELIIAVETDDTVTVQLRTHGLEASGSAAAVVKRFRDLSTFALADVPIVGNERRSKRCVAGKVSVGLVWSSSGNPGSTFVAGTALADGNWSGGLIRFSSADHYSFSRKMVRLICTTPFPQTRSRFIDPHR